MSSFLLGITIGFIVGIIIGIIIGIIGISIIFYIRARAKMKSILKKIQEESGGD